MPLTNKSQKMKMPDDASWKTGFKFRLPKIGFTKPSRFFKRMDKGGFIDSDVPGRTDKHYVTVPAGAYVLPADHVSALGENNSVAGAGNVGKEIEKRFGPGTKHGARLKLPKFAGGGSVNSVPIIVAGGEVILPSDVVRRIGSGDLEKGHSKLDEWVLETREKHIAKLKSLKPPKGSE